MESTRQSADQNNTADPEIQNTLMTSLPDFKIYGKLKKMSINTQGLNLN